MWTKGVPGFWPTAIYYDSMGLYNVIYYPIYRYIIQYIVGSENRKKKRLSIMDLGLRGSSPRLHSQDADAHEHLRGAGTGQLAGLVI